jgi:predicted acylesterase/phospholipase RssA
MDLDSKPRKILAFDGGPSALVYIRVIQKMEEQFPGFLDKVDLFAGTSFGGLLSLKLAVLLADNVPAARAIQETIDFADDFVDLFKMTPTGLLRMASGFLPMISSQGILDFLEMHFSRPDENEPGKRRLLTMSDLDDKKKVAVSAFDLNIGELRTYDSFERLGGNRTLLSVALACCSVPVFMPFLKPAGDDSDPIVDGGFGANSGAMPALSAALRDARRDGIGAGALLPYVSLLSMGCQTTDAPVRIPLISNLLDWADARDLIGKEREVPDGNSLRSIGWFFLLRNNVKLALALLENTQALDWQYANDLLDARRYHRMEPGLEVLKLIWWMLTDKKHLIDEARRFANDYWSKQLTRYAVWKEPKPGEPPPALHGDDQLACWISWYWVREQKPAQICPCCRRAA